MQCCTGYFIINRVLFDKLTIKGLSDSAVPDELQPFFNILLIMNILNVLSSDNYIVAHKTIIQKLNLECAVLIGYFASQQVRNSNKHFIQTYDNIEQFTGIKIHTARKAIKLLKSEGILLIERKGLPCKTYYSLDQEMVEILLEDTANTSPIENDRTRAIENDRSLYNKEYLTIRKFNKKNKQKKIFEETKLIKSQFDDFWKSYPNKKGSKGVTKTSFEKLCNKSDKPTFTQLVNSLENQKNSPRWREQPLYIPHASTWLNQQRWLDDPNTLVILNFEKDNQTQRSTTYLEEGTTYSNGISLKEAQEKGII